jgi:pimeloyl-ACP methyl ester carboxylesterase
MKQKRQKSVLGLGWACFEAAAFGRTEHAQTVEIYPETVVRRFKFQAGGGYDWRIHALETPRAKPTPWKIVVITGAPSWAEYWADTMAALPQDRQMVVVDRPGFAASEPHLCIPDIRVQARALESVLTAAPGQKILLVGQSYGAAIAALMAANNPRKVAGVVMLSSFLGETGPTARWLVETGEKILHLIPRDLRHAILEVTGQADQLHLLRAALGKLTVPVHVIHGDRDDFAPIETAERLASEVQTLRPIRFHAVPGANHFMNDGPGVVLERLEACIAAEKPAWRMPPLPKLVWPFAPAPGASVQDAVGA